MKNKFGLIYFLHDDISRLFRRDIIPTLAEVPASENIKVILIHNQRQQILDGDETLITYKTVISELKKDTYGITFFNTLKDSLDDWQNAFTFVFNYLKKENYFDRIGLIALSHSNGLLLNKPGSDVFTDEASLSQNNSSFNSIVRKINKTEFFVNTETIFEKTERLNASGGKVYKCVYKRDRKPPCQTFEGIFFAQLAVCIKEKLYNFGQKKFDFFISNNCNFQLYENIFLFSDVTRFTMGAESFNSINFFHFPTVIGAIEQTLENNIRSTCELIFKLCADRFSKNVKKHDKHYFLVDCEQFMKKVHPLFNIMTEILAQNVIDKNISTKITRSVKNRLFIVSDVKKLSYYDMMQTYRQAKRIISLRKFDAAFNKLLKILSTKSVVVSTVNRDGRDVCGFALYLPVNKSDSEILEQAHCNYFGRVVNGKRNPFSVKTKYDDFLKHLH